MVSGCHYPSHRGRGHRKSLPRWSNSAISAGRQASATDLIRHLAGLPFSLGLSAAIQMARESFRSCADSRFICISDMSMIVSLRFAKRPHSALLPLQVMLMHFIYPTPDIARLTQQSAGPRSRHSLVTDRCRSVTPRQSSLCTRPVEGNLNDSLISAFPPLGRRPTMR